jgi:hypothetical protein
MLEKNSSWLDSVTLLNIGKSLIIPFWLYYWKAIKRGFGSKTTYQHMIKNELSPDMSGNFFDKIDRINPPASPERERWRAGKIFLYSLYPEHPVYPV